MRTIRELSLSFCNHHHLRRLRAAATSESSLCHRAGPTRHLRVGVFFESPAKRERSANQAYRRKTLVNNELNDTIAFRREKKNEEEEEKKSTIEAQRNYSAYLSVRRVPGRLPNKPRTQAAVAARTLPKTCPRASRSCRLATLAGAQVGPLVRTHEL